MQKVFIYSIGVIAILVGGFFAFNSYIYQEKQEVLPEDHLDATYIIDGALVTLENGRSEVVTAPGSASKMIYQYFGNEISHDINGDGVEDQIFLLTVETGGSGIFYYVLAGVKTNEGYRGSQGVFLGDRIAPQTLEKGPNGTVVVNYAVRGQGESFDVAPSIGKTLRLKFDSQSNMFGEVVADFEGEADPSRMTLDMKSWLWIAAFYNDGREIRPRERTAFRLTFSPDGSFSATTDCNNLSGRYTAKDGELTFSNIASTKMYCEGSLENDFTAFLTNTSAFHFTSRGELILDLKFDSGAVIFR